MSKIKALFKFFFTIPNTYPKFWEFFKLFIIAIPSCLFAISSYNLSQGADQYLVDIQTKIKKIFEGKTCFWFLISMPFLLPLLFGYWKATADSIYQKMAISESQYGIVISAIEEIVGKKLQRFGKFYDKIKNKNTINNQQFPVKLLHQPGMIKIFCLA